MATKVNYAVKVINTPNGLTGYTSPNTSSKKITTFDNGSVLTANGVVSNDEGVWYQESESKAWMPYMSSRGKTSLKNVKVLKNANKNNRNKKLSVFSNLRVPLVKIQSAQTTPVTPKEKNTSGKVSYQRTATVNSNSPLVPRTLKTDVIQQNEMNYPPKIGSDGSGSILYDWSINMSQFSNMVLTIKKNLNIPSAYTRNDIARLTKTKFNQYKIEFGDYKLKPTIAFVVFTRPDLNLFDSDKKILAQISNDPQLYYIWRNNPSIMKQLTLDYAESHKFIPLLTNQITALDVADETLEVAETGETWTGFKTQFAKNSVRSMTAGSISVKFPETSDLSITHMMQTWCSYESGVYRGTLIPKDEYCFYKILDYACNIYYFLMDRDWTIRFWTTYYGAFPTNVNKSIFSYDMGSDSGGADVNVTFNYFHKLDMDIRSLVDFNNLGGEITNSTVYKTDTSPDICLGGGGSTWTGPPFVQVTHENNGEDTIDLLKFRFRVE